MSVSVPVSASRRRGGVAYCVFRSIGWNSETLRVDPPAISEVLSPQAVGPLLMVSVRTPPVRCSRYRCPCASVPGPEQVPGRPGFCPTRGTWDRRFGHRESVILPARVEHPITSRCGPEKHPKHGSSPGMGCRRTHWGWSRSSSQHMAVGFFTENEQYQTWSTWLWSCSF